MASTQAAPAAIADLEVAARRFQALADPTRLRIIGMLGHGERCVCELMAELDIAQSRLSFHLRVLREATLVTPRREGQWVYYTLRTEALEQLGATLDMSPASWRRAAARCCA